MVNNFNPDKYRQTFNNRFGEGRYEQGIQNATDLGRLQVEASLAKKEFERQQRELEAQRKKAEKEAAKAKAIEESLAPKKGSGNTTKKGATDLLGGLIGTAKKVGGGLSKIGSEIARFDDRAVNALTFGLSGEADKKIQKTLDKKDSKANVTDYLKPREQGDTVGKGLDIAATIAGSLVPGIGATAALRGAGVTGKGVKALADARKAGISTKGLRKTAAIDAAKEGAIVGGALSGAEIGVRQGLNKEDNTSLIDEAKYFGLSTLLGGALDPLLAVGAPLARDATRQGLRNTVDNAIGKQAGQSFKDAIENPATFRRNSNASQTNRDVPTPVERNLTSSDSLQETGRNVGRNTNSPLEDLTPPRRVSDATTPPTRQELEQLVQPTRSADNLDDGFNRNGPTEADVNQSFIDRTVYKNNPTLRERVTKAQESFTNDLAPIRAIDKQIQKLDKDGIIEFLEPKTLIPSRTKSAKVSSSAEKSFLQAKGAPSVAAQHVVDRFQPLLSRVNSSKTTGVEELGDYAFSKNGLRRFADDAQARADRDGFQQDLDDLIARGQGNSEEAKVLQGLIDDYVSYTNVRGATPDVLEAQVAKFEQNPELVENYKEFAKVQRQNLDDLYEGGLITEKTYNKLLENDTYISTVRNFGDGVDNPGSASRRAQNPLERLKGGSEFKIKDPVLGAIRNAYETRFNIEKNKALQIVPKFAKIDKDGVIGFKGVKEPNARTVTVFQNGKEKYYEVPQEFKNYVDNIKADNDPDVLTNIVQKAALFQRKLTTQYSVAFQLKSLVRENAQVIVTSRTAKTSAHAAANTAIGYLDAFVGPALQNATKNLPEKFRFKSFKADFDAQGGTGFQYIKTTDEDLKNIAQKMFETGTTKGNVKRLNPFNLIAKAGEKIEQGPRLGEFRSAKNQGYSNEDAFFEATDVTNYRRAGNFTRKANKYDNFLNATIQGNARVAAAFKEAPERTIARGVTLLSGTAFAAYALRSHENVSETQQNELRNLSQFEKDAFLHIPSIIEGDDTIIAIPKAFGIGQLFMNPVEKALDDYTDNTINEKSVPQNVKESIVSTIKAFLPPTDVALATTALELNANKDFFLGTEIENKFDKDAGVPKKDIEAYNQSVMTKTISDAINAMSFGTDPDGVVSPAQVDFLVKSLIGSVGKNALETSDNFLADNAPTKTLQDRLVNPISQFRADPTRASGVYSELQKLAKVEKRDNADISSLVGEDAKNAERANRPLQNFEKLFKDINKEIQAVRSDSSLSSQEKKDQITALRREQDALGSLAIDRQNSYR